MTYSVMNDRLLQGGREVPFVPTPNQGGRIEPALIVVHFTADHLDPQDSVRWFAQEKSKVSAHLIIGRDGTITQMVEFDRVAYHAGKSAWQGRSGCNGFAIGIEMDNPGKLTPRGNDGVAWFGTRFDRAEYRLVEHRSDKYGSGLWMPYSPEQMEALGGVIVALLEAYPSIVDIRGHDEICVPANRKDDPGPLMDMAALRAMLGSRAPASTASVREAQTVLAALGYSPGDVDGLIGPRTRAALRSFQEQNGLHVTGALDGITSLRLFGEAPKPMPTGTRETEPVEQAPGTWVVKRGAEGTASTTLIEATANYADPLQAIDGADKAIAHAEKGRAVVQRSTGILDWLIAYLQTPQGLRVGIVLTLCLITWIIAHRTDVRARLARLVGRPA